MSGPVATRPAEPSDCPAIAQLVAAAYGPYVERIGRPPGPMLADYADVVSRGQTWVAQDDDGGLLGVLVLERAEDHLLLNNVAVRPGVQRRGVGRLLLQLAEERAAALGLPEIRLYTNEAMSENLNYYPRHGYLETHRTTENGYRRVFFTKVLRSAKHERSV